MQSWIAETWNILIAWERGVVRSKAVIRERLFHHDSPGQQSYMQGRYPTHANFFDFKVRIAQPNPTQPGSLPWLPIPLAYAALVLFAGGLCVTLIWFPAHVCSFPYVSIFLQWSILVLAWSPSLCSSFGCNNQELIWRLLKNYCILRKANPFASMISSS